MNYSSKKSKIEVTQRSREKTTYQATPPKFRTNEHYIQTEATSRQSSRYQTLSHKTNPSCMNLPPQYSKNSSLSKKSRNLQIDTDMINEQHERKRSPSLKKAIGATPLFASEDSVTILHRMQKERKNTKVSYDNLIDAVKLNYNHDEENKINLSNDFFQISQSNVNSKYNTKNNSSLEHPAKKSIRNIYKQIDDLKNEIGNNLKLEQITDLLEEIDYQISKETRNKIDHKSSLRAQTELKTSTLQANEIESSLIPKDYINQGYNWFSKDKKQNCPRREENQRVRTTIDEKDPKARANNHKNKSPLREILNYVNKKK